MTNLDAGAQETPPHPPAEAGPPGARWPAAVAGGVVLIGATALVTGRDLEYWTALGPGPGFFPRWLGILLVVLGALWLVQIWRTRRAATAPEPASETGTDPEDRQPLPVTAAIVVSLCALAALLEVIGFQLAMLLFLLFHLLVLGRRGWILSAVIAAAGSFGVFVLFTRFLTVPLPVASIPFLQQLGL